MNMHPTYRARRLRALAVAAAGLAALFAWMLVGGFPGALLLLQMMAVVVIGCGVALRRLERGIA